MWWNRFAASRNPRFLLVPGLIIVVIAMAVLNGQPAKVAQHRASNVSPSVASSNISQNASAKPQSARSNEKPNYLSTSGSKIVDSEGHEVHLAGVNWFGMETQTFSPHGLWARNWKDMLDQIAASGFNTIRLPFSSEVLDPDARPMEGIDYDLNPDLKGLTALQVMDKIVEGAGQRGLKVILDQHRPDTQAQSALWYTDDLSEAQWIADWQTLAKRYLGNDTVIGVDLHNEPAGAATWGSNDPKTDWRAAAEKAGNAVLDVNPNLLIIVEGVEKIGNDWYWMGGNLENAGKYPIELKVPNKLVYSAHDYGPGVSNQSWFHDPHFPANLPAVWDKHWGYLVEQNIAPVIVGEFGGRSVGNDTEGAWQRALLSYMKEHDISFTYWAFNPNSVDTGGILEDDWKTVNQAKENMLKGYLMPKLAVNDPDVVHTSEIAVGSRKNPLPAQALKAQVAVGSTDSSTDQLSLKLSLVNQTAAHVPLSSVELRYWLSPADAALATLANPVTSGSKATGAKNILGITWASMDGINVKLVGGKDGAMPYLQVTFGKDGPAMDSFGKAEVQLTLSRLDKLPFIQKDDYSFKASSSPVDDNRVGVYYWGQLVWGKEPPSAAAKAASPQTRDSSSNKAPAGTPSGAAHGSQPGTSAHTAAPKPAPSVPSSPPQPRANGGTGSSVVTAPPVAPMPAVPSASPAPVRQYVVKPGDTLSSIAAQIYGDPNAWSRIAQANAGRITDPNAIQPGQVIALPAP